MSRIVVKFTAKELELLCNLASDQLFRKEFIDSRLPGCNSSRSELALEKQLVARLRAITDRGKRLQPLGVAVLKKSGSARPGGIRTSAKAAGGD